MGTVKSIRHESFRRDWEEEFESALPPFQFLNRGR